MNEKKNGKSYWDWGEKSEERVKMLNRRVRKRIERVKEIGGEKHKKEKEKGGKKKNWKKKTTTKNKSLTKASRVSGVDFFSNLFIHTKRNDSQEDPNPVYWWDSIDFANC